MTVAEPYVCPGEERPISRSVHLARLAAFDPACRMCSRRHEAGPFPLITPEDLEIQARAARPTYRRALLSLLATTAVRIRRRSCMVWDSVCDGWVVA